VASTVALLLTVVLGGLAVSMPAVAAGAGVATAVILLAKQRLHHMIREKLTELELVDALKFFVAAFIVLPLMPHVHLGPYGVLDPRRLWTFVVAVTAVGWLGYVAVRLAGPTRGLPAAGLAGGFISSAATTGSMARTSRDPKLFRPAMAAALLATVSSLALLVAVTAVASTHVAVLLLPAAALGALVLLAEAWWLLNQPERKAAAVRTGIDTTVETRSGEPADNDGVVVSGGTVVTIDFGASSHVDEADPPTMESEPGPRRRSRALVGRRPFDLVPALLLTAILAVFLMVAALAQHALGLGGAVLTIAAAGLADSHAGALTAANLATQSTLSVHVAVLASAAALAANTVVKLVLAHVAGGARASTALARYFAAPALAVALGLALTLSLF
jgi:uncharacterized membrane protein (DUF4010 family)